MEKILKIFSGALFVTTSALFAQNSDTPKNDIKTILQNNSVFWSRLGWAYDPPIVADGKIRMMLSDDSLEKKVHADFQKADIKIHSTLIHLGWIGKDSYDYSATDKTLDELFAVIGKDALYIPRIKLNVPPSWCAENPEDTCLYYPDTLSKEKIAKLANTPAHDWMGWESASGYTTDIKVKGVKDPRPNVGGLIGLQSFSSKKWRRDAGEALRRFIEHLENGKYGKNIIAYHIAYGQCGETTPWRSWTKDDSKYGDYGINNKRAFFDWGIKKYGSRENLAKAWNQPNISRDNVKLPSPMERDMKWENHADFFRASEQGLISRDFDKFGGETNAEALEYFCKIVKEKTGKPAGAFFGYYLFVPRSAYAGHLEYDALLDSPYVDFFASPKGYRNVRPGESGMEQSPPMSINLKKIFIEELDVRTHLARKADAKNFAGTRNMLWREFAKCMQSKSGYWWMDLHGGWFNSPEIMAEIVKIEKVAKKIRALEQKSVAEVLVVSDTESMYYAKNHDLLHRDQIQDTIARIRMAGAPVDHYRLSDLKNIDLSNYKVVLFINCVRITNENWNKISPKLRSNATLVWHHAPAIWGEEYNLVRSEKITGFKLKPRKISKNEIIKFADKKFPQIKKEFGQTKPYPTFAAVNPEESLASYTDNSVAFAKTKFKGWTSYFVSMPILPSEVYREIFDNAQVQSPAPVNCAVYMDNRFCGIFSRNKVEFALQLQGEFKDEVSLKTLKHGDKIKLPAAGEIVLTCKKQGNRE